LVSFLFDAAKRKETGDQETVWVKKMFASKGQRPCGTFPCIFARKTVKL
jgi:hypothetical protein